MAKVQPPAKSLDMWHLVIFGLPQIRPLSSMDLAYCTRKNIWDSVGEAALAASRRQKVNWWSSQLSAGWK